MNSVCIFFTESYVDKYNGKGFDCTYRVVWSFIRPDLSCWNRNKMKNLFYLLFSKNFFYKFDFKLKKI
jgi:hypothetical protein